MSSPPARTIQLWLTVHRFVLAMFVLLPAVVTPAFAQPFANRSDAEKARLDDEPRVIQAIKSLLN